MVYGKLSYMEKTTLYLPAELQRALRELARRSGRPQAELIREALSDYVARQPRRLPKSIGLGSDTELAAADSEAWLEREWRADD